MFVMSYVCLNRFQIKATDERREMKMRLAIDVFRIASCPHAPPFQLCIFFSVLSLTSCKSVPRTKQVWFISLYLCTFYYQISIEACWNRRNDVKARNNHYWPFFWAQTDGLHLKNVIVKNTKLCLIEHFAS